MMVHIPGLGTVPLSALQNIPGFGGFGGRQAPQQAPQPPTDKEWDSFTDFPFSTQESLQSLLGELHEDNRDTLTILLLGRGGVGKSSTVNSIFNERAASSMAFQPDSGRPLMFSRTLSTINGDFTLRLIDTPSVMEGDKVSDGRLELIAGSIKDLEIDVVLYLDRLDALKVDSSDRNVIKGISRVLGADIWDNTVIGFTRASSTSAPPGVTFEDHVKERTNQVRSAIKAGGKGISADLPVVLIENSSRCQMNAGGEKVVLNATQFLNGDDDFASDNEIEELAWIVELIEQTANLAYNTPPFLYDPKAAQKASNPDRSSKWLIPIALIAQFGLKVLLDRAIYDDSINYGPYGKRSPGDQFHMKKQKRKKMLAI